MRCRSQDRLALAFYFGRAALSHEGLPGIFLRRRIFRRFLAPVARPAQPAAPPAPERLKDVLKKVPIGLGRTEHGPQPKLQVVPFCDSHGSGRTQRIQALLHAGGKAILSGEPAKLDDAQLYAHAQALCFGSRHLQPTSVSIFSIPAALILAESSIDL